MELCVVFCVFVVDDVIICVMIVVVYVSSGELFCLYMVMVVKVL